MDDLDIAIEYLTIYTGNIKNVSQFCPNSSRLRFALSQSRCLQLHSQPLEGTGSWEKRICACVLAYHIEI